MAQVVVVGEGGPGVVDILHVGYSPGGEHLHEPRCRRCGWYDAECHQMPTLDVIDHAAVHADSCPWVPA